MKCPHCGKEHIDNPKFCPETGKKMEPQAAPQALVCQNPDCEFREPLPPGTRFCPNCRFKFDIDAKETKQQDHSESDSHVIIAYTRIEDWEGEVDENRKMVDIFWKNKHENFVVRHDIFWHSLCEFHQLRKGTEFVRLEDTDAFNLRSFIEISKDGLRKGLSWEETQKDVENSYGNNSPIGFKYQEAPSKDPCNPYLSVKTKKRYSTIANSYLFRTYIKRSGTYIDIFDRESERCLYNNIFISEFELDASSGLIDRHGWQGLYVDDSRKSGSCVQLLINDEHYFKLESDEMPVDNSMYDPTWKPEYKLWHFASDERILTVFQNGEYIPNYEDITCIRMRDKAGNIVKTIDATGLYLKANFKFGRCLATKTQNGRSWLVFIDENGNLNDIPNTSFNCTPQDLECFFVTKEVLVMLDPEVIDIDGYLDDENRARMIDIKGNVIYHCWSLNELTEGFVSYYEDGYVGVLDHEGNVVLPAKYDDVDIL